MVKIEPFAVHNWMRNHGATAKYNLSESCAASVSIEDLINLSENSEQSTQNISLASLKLTYGIARGSDQLRENLAARYGARTGGFSKDHILITNGAIAANYLVLYAIIGAGDHVICQYPTCEQLYQVPATFGAEVSLWKMESGRKWALDVEQLKGIIKDNTRMIILNNPNNPSGAVVPAPILQQVIDLAQEKNIIVLCDEVYRPLFHSISPADEDFPSSAVNMGYKQVIVTGSTSKAYSLPGIRTGWVVTKDTQLLDAMANSQFYTSISVSQLDQLVAAEAISENCIHGILGRNIQLAKKNLQILTDFIDEHNWACSWTKPVAGTTAMVKFHKMGKPVNDEKFCDILLDKAGVMLVPGSKCFGQGEDFRGFVRISYALDSQVLVDGLAALKDFMEEHYEDVPTLKKAKSP